MDKLVMALSSVLFTVTWGAVIFVYMQVNEEVYVGNPHEVMVDSAMVEKEPVTIIAAKTSVDPAVDKKPLDPLSTDQPFHDGVSIDELLDYFDLNEEAVPST